MDAPDHGFEFRNLVRLQRFRLIRSLAAGTPYTVEGSAKVDRHRWDGGGHLLRPASVRPPSAARARRRAANTVSVSFSVNASNCATGIAGTVALTGLPAGYEASSGSLRAISDATQTSVSWTHQNPHDYMFSLAPGLYSLPGSTFIEGLGPRP